MSASATYMHRSYRGCRAVPHPLFTFPFSENNSKLHPLSTLAVALSGGAAAALVYAPVPWLLGSLLATALITGFGVKLYRYSLNIEQWMRVLIGVALGPAVANSLRDFGSSTLIAVAASIASIVILVVVGSWFFKRFLSMSRAEAFLCSLPGGLSFMMALADDTRVASKGSRPRIALVHTVRVVSLVLFVSVIAYFFGTDIQRTRFTDWFLSGLTLDWQLVLLAVLAILGGVLANVLRIAGGHVTLPLLVSVIAYTTGIIDIAMPQLVITVAMLTFGSILGCELGNGPRREYPGLALGSLLFTALAFAVGALFATLFGKASGIGFLTFFLALAPGGIAEVALIALSLGLDVGLIALVHLCRFMFIMLAGPVGLRVIGGASTKAE